MGGLPPHASKTRVTSLHLMMGRDLLDVSSVPAGCICGIGGLGQVCVCVSVCVCV